MDLAMVVYLINVLGSLSCFATFMAIGFGSLGIISGIEYVVSKDSEYKGDRECAKTANNVFKIALWVFVPSVFLSIFIPSEKTMYTMAGAYAAEVVVKDPKVQQLSGKVLEIIENKLDKLAEKK